MITEIHLIHHTHHDLGYTDAPETANRLHRETLVAALEMARQDGSDEASLFRWTCEVFEPVEQLLAQQPALGASLEHLVAAGRVEVCAMPFNLTTLIGTASWETILTRLNQLAPSPRASL